MKMTRRKIKRVLRGRRKMQCLKNSKTFFFLFRLDNREATTPLPKSGQGNFFLPAQLRKDDEKCTRA
ncbi:hypothetical protein E2C01_101974 [Portunus trituberculatus]|uniref:Uncharacterized protein n=1 Tax=Portunus trituberculatus TaxID=210409 RepID=A0A5B7KB76_PORTR|nr:hypothetical protein [Portunus trituberculatus]